MCCVLECVSDVVGGVVCCVGKTLHCVKDTLKKCCDRHCKCHRCKKNKKKPKKMKMY